MKKLGRKSNISKELINDVFNLFKTGLNAREVCLSIGIGESTYYYWLKKAEEILNKVNNERCLPNKEDVLFLDFLEATKKGRLELKKYHIEKINNDPSWQSSAWYLERVYSDEFAKNKDIATNSNTTINIIASEKIDGLLKLIQNRKTAVQAVQAGAEAAGEGSKDSSSDLEIS